MPGLSKTAPHGMKAVPFGNESWTQEAFGLTEGQLAVVVALVAASVSDDEPLPWSAAKLAEKVRFFDCHKHLSSLERRCWVECCGKVPGTTAKLWRPTARAIRRLKLDKWDVDRQPVQRPTEAA